MTTTTVTFTNSDNSNAIVLTIANANPPIIEVAIDSGHPYTTQVLELNQTYSLQLRKQGVVKTAFLTVTSNPFGCDLNDLFNGTTPTPAKVTFINSDPSNTITLSVRDDQGNTVVDDVSVTNSDPYVIDTLKLDATYSVHLEREGASKQDISLPITSSPFTYDVYTPFLNDAIVVFTNSDKSTSIRLSVLDDEGVPVVSDVVVSPGSNPYITTLQLKETYKLLLVKGTAQAESSLTITSNPFTYDVDTPFTNNATVTFANSDESRSIRLSILDDEGVPVVSDVVVGPGSNPYITTLQLKETYKLLLVRGTVLTESSVTISSDPFFYDVNKPFEVQVTFTNSDPSNAISLSVPDDKGGYLIKDVSVTNSQPYVTGVLDLNQTYTLKLTKAKESAQLSVVISYDGYTVNINFSFEGVNVKFTTTGVYSVSLSVLDGQGGYPIKDVLISYFEPYATGVLNLNATYTLELKVIGFSLSAQTYITFNPNRLTYDVHTPFSAEVTFTNSLGQWSNVSFDVLYNNEKVGSTLGVRGGESYTSNLFLRNVTYTLKSYWDTRQTTITITHTPFVYDVGAVFGAGQITNSDQ